jgi:hypothetical protein
LVSGRAVTANNPLDVDAIGEKRTRLWSWSKDASEFGPMFGLGNSAQRSKHGTLIQLDTVQIIACYATTACFLSRETDENLDLTLFCCRYSSRATNCRCPMFSFSSTRIMVLPVHLPHRFPTSRHFSTSQKSSEVLSLLRNGYLYALLLMFRGTCSNL